MKKKALIAAVLAATTLTATTAFAAQNPFKDLPEGHWAYDAVTMLAQDGVIDGYGDGNFNGNKLMNRYEIAEIVSKAMAKYDGARPQDKGAIKKLEKEFGAELQDMDVRLKGVEEDVKQLKKGQSSIKWYGDARVRYFENKDMKLHNNSSTTKGSVVEKRVRLGVYAEPAKNLSVDGRLKYEDSSFKHDGWGGDNQSNWDGSYDNHNSFRLDKFSLNWNHANTKLSVGRTEISLGQGLLYWENPVDGAYVQHQFGPKVTAMIGVGDISAAGWQDSNIGAQFANISVKASPATTITVANLHTNTTMQTAKVSYWTWNGTVGKSTTWTDDAYKLNQYSVGLNTQLAPKWNLIAEYVRNNAGVLTNKNGLWTRLTYGKMVWNKANTWQVYGETFSFGGGVIDSLGWQHRLNIAGGSMKSDGFAGDKGVRGWGLGVGYMLAPNTNFEVTYYQLKPYDENAAGFTSYDKVGYAALTYSF